LICEFELDLRLFINDCRRTQRSSHFNKKYFETYFKDNYGKSDDPEANIDENGNEIKIECPEIEWHDKESFYLICRKDLQGNDLGNKPVKVRFDLRLIPMD